MPRWRRTSRSCRANFFADPDANHGHLRLNFSHIDPARLNEGIKRLASVVRAAQNLKAA
ncbi:Aminotransferase, s I and II [Pseudomonas savastanoi pv. phaseolicola]|nr:Aminotransferase, s I and II [Pseudomonas savastanoi pv. phaseolicola]